MIASQRITSSIAALSLLLSLLIVSACTTYGPSHGGDLDGPAMSTTLDRHDLDHIFEHNFAPNLFGSRFISEVASAKPRHTIAILPFLNDTSEHISPQLQALLSKMETSFVNDGRLAVVAAERRDEILAELEVQQGSAFNANRAAEYGRQLGARYLITGKVYDSAERTADMRRVQYFMFMQVIDVETGIIQWQQSADVTKAIVPLDY